MRWPKSVSFGFTTATMALTVLTVAPAFASPVPYLTTGIEFGSNSSGALVAVTTNAPCISFAGSNLCTSAITPYDISAGGDPIFVPGTAQGTIKDIAVTFPIVAFKTANITVGGGPVIFDLLNIIAPVGFAACDFNTVSGSCSTGSFILTQNGAAVGIQLNTNEIGYVGTSANATPYQGIFTSQVIGNLTQYGCVVSANQTCTPTIANILRFEATSAQTTAAGLGAIGQSGTIRSSWSVQEAPFTSSVPEPTSFVLIGGGLLGLGFFAKRRKSVA